MKKHFFLPILLLSLTVHGQSPLKTHPLEANPPEKEHFEVYSFQIEQQCHLSIHKSQGSSDVTLMSQNNGGEVYKRIQTSADGLYTEKVKASQMPAFAKNTRGFIQFFDMHAFYLKNIGFEQQGFFSTVSFDALANKEKDIRYELYAIMKEKEIQLKEKTASNSESWEQIDWTIEAPYAPAYVLKVYGQEKLRYTETFWPTQKKLHYHFYPSLAEEQVFIELTEMPDNLSYVLLNARGQKIRTARLQKKHNSLFISKLPAGRYYLHINKGEKTLGAESFVKPQ